MGDLADDPLRRQVETALAAAASVRPRMVRGVPLLIAVAGVVLALSLVMNLIVLAAPGALGLERTSDGDALRGRVSALEAGATPAAATAAGATSSPARLDRRVDAVQARLDASLPVICERLAALGDWSWNAGRPPAQICPAAVRGR